MIAGTSSKDESVAAQPKPLRLVVGTILHTLLLPGSLVVGLPYWLLDSGDHGSAAVPLLQVLFGAILTVLGSGVLAICFWDFVVSGKGTPNPLEPPRILVSERLYRYMRNPIYASVVTIVFGEALMFGATVLVVYAGVVWLVLHGLVISYEEPTLRRDFGARYESYRREVPRWIPRLPSR